LAAAGLRSKVLTEDPAVVAAFFPPSPDDMVRRASSSSSDESSSKEVENFGLGRVVAFGREAGGRAEGVAAVVETLEFTPPDAGICCLMDLVESSPPTAPLFDTLLLSPRGDRRGAIAVTPVLPAETPAAAGWLLLPSSLLGWSFIFLLSFGKQLSRFQNCFRSDQNQFYELERDKTELNFDLNGRARARIENAV
jgi:hypothetical protein